MRRIGLVVSAVTMMMALSCADSAKSPVVSVPVKDGGSAQLGRLAEPDLAAVVDRLVQVLASRGDLRDVTPPEGLLLVLNGTPQHVVRDTLPGVLSDPTVRSWPGPECEACVEGTFAQVVGDSFLATVHDPDAVVGVNEVVLGSGQVANDPPPALAGLDYVSVHDPGDRAELEGHDWTTWVLYVQDVDDGEQRVAGLALYEWGP